MRRWILGSMVSVLLFAGVAILGRGGVEVATWAEGNPGAVERDLVRREVTLVVSGDTYLRSGAPDRSLGKEAVLRLQASGSNRALVAFDREQLAGALAGAEVVSARLEVTIYANGSNWGPGRAVDAHLVVDPWTETGATWHCAEDLAPANSQADCTPRWDGGTFEAAPTASVLHTDDLEGVIDFDVTGDVLAFGDGLPFEGWLLKKAEEGQPGQVEYASREVCGLEPRLVLVLDGPADQAPPQLSISSPTERFLVRPPVAPIDLRFADLGSPLEPESFEVRLDGEDLTSTCTVCSAGAICPWPALGEGSHTVEAEIRDAAGNLAFASHSFDLLLGDGEHRLTLPAVADTYLRSGGPNQNQGAETALRLRSSGKNRALVSFDLSSLGDLVDTLYSATLEVFIEANGDNWGTSGRTVDAHRLRAPWSETGATWNCSDDVNPANQSADCSGGWAGGTFDSAPTARVLHTNGEEGWVGYDVTADVVAALAGGPDFGWLLKKTEEGQAGLVEYTSREGAAGQGPRLVLVFEGGEPQDTEVPELAFSAPAEGATIDDPTPTLALTWADAGSGVDPATLAILHDGDPLAVDCSFAPEGATCEPAEPFAPGPVALTATVEDFASNVSAPAGVTFTVAESPDPGLPPDPATVAPPLDRTVATDVFTSTQFLYSGEDPIQTGVAPGTIDRQRAAVLRGRVLTREGDPLPGTRVSILGHPDFGETLSRADGMYDLAVNGGGALVLDFEKEGYLPAQRTVEAPWRDFAWAEDVALVALDPEVTVIASGAAQVQAARGGQVEDEDGARRATLLFPAGTTAELVLADGQRVPAPQLSVRATEYTVGPNGPQAMPGPLPPTVAYTYAAELSADEAMAAGAMRVEFSQPVFFYVENFLGFSVGGVVPVGWYDRQAAAWVGSDNGRVIEVLSADEEGRARIALDGDGEAASPFDLDELGFTDGERVELARLYAPGTSLWRSPIPHFTAWDWNWPYMPPVDAETPPDDDLGDDEGEDVEEPECTEGSILECENQVLGERLPLAGTPLTLHYRSDRVRGRNGAFTWKIKVTGASVPASLREVELRLAIGGRQVEQTFPPTPNQTFTFTWDGTDAYGRRVQGGTPFVIRNLAR